MRASNPNQPIPICSLLDLRRGSRAVVRGYGQELPQDLARRLVSMGLPIGMEAEVLVRRARGPILLRADESRIALGQDEARAIRVEPTDSPSGSPTGSPTDGAEDR